MFFTYCTKRCLLKKNIGGFLKFYECPAVNAYHACRVVLCQISVTGNGKILHSTYLLAVKTQKSTWAHFTLQIKLDRTIHFLAFRHTVFNAFHPLQQMLSKQIVQKEMRNCVEYCIRSSFYLNPWSNLTGAASTYHILSCLPDLWKIVMSFTRSSKGGSPQLHSISCFYLDGNVMGHQVILFNCVRCFMMCLPWRDCLVSRKRVRRRERKLSKTFSQNHVCAVPIYWAKICLSNTDIFSQKMFLNFYQNKNVASSTAQKLSVFV